MNMSKPQEGSRLLGLRLSHLTSRCNLLIALLTCLAAASASAAAYVHHARHSRHQAIAPIIRRIDPTSLLFEVDAATARVVPPSPYPKSLKVYGSHFSTSSHIRANGVPVKTIYISHTRLNADIKEIENHLITDKDNSRLSYVDITVVSPATGQKSTEAIRFTHFVEGNAGG